MKKKGYVESWNLQVSFCDAKTTNQNLKKFGEIIVYDLKLIVEYILSDFANEKEGLCWKL